MPKGVCQWPAPTGLMDGASFAEKLNCGFEHLTPSQERRPQDCHPHSMSPFSCDIKSYRAGTGLCLPHWQSLAKTDRRTVA